MLRFGPLQTGDGAPSGGSLEGATERERLAAHARFAQTAPVTPSPLAFLAGFSWKHKTALLWEK